MKKKELEIKQRQIKELESLNKRTYQEEKKLIALKIFVEKYKQGLVDIEREFKQHTAIQEHIIRANKIMEDGNELKMRKLVDDLEKENLDKKDSLEFLKNHCSKMLYVQNPEETTDEDNFEEVPFDIKLSDYPELIGNKFFANMVKRLGIEEFKFLSLRMKKSKLKQEIHEIFMGTETELGKVDGMLHKIGMLEGDIDLRLRQIQSMSDMKLRMNNRFKPYLNNYMNLKNDPIFFSLGEGRKVYHDVVTDTEYLLNKLETTDVDNKNEIEERVQNLVKNRIKIEETRKRAELVQEELKAIPEIKVVKKETNEERTKKTLEGMKHFLFIINPKLYKSMCAEFRKRESPKYEKIMLKWMDTFEHRNPDFRSTSRSMSRSRISSKRKRSFGIEMPPMKKKYMKTSFFKRSATKISKSSSSSSEEEFLIANKMKKNVSTKNIFGKSTGNLDGKSSLFKRNMRNGDGHHAFGKSHLDAGGKKSRKQPSGYRTSIYANQIDILRGNKEEIEFILKFYNHDEKEIEKEVMEHVEVRIEIHQNLKQRIVSLIKMVEIKNEHFVSVCKKLERLKSLYSFDIGEDEYIERNLVEYKLELEEIVSSNEKNFKLCVKAVQLLFSMKERLFAVFTKFSCTLISIQKNSRQNFSLKIREQIEKLVKNCSKWNRDIKLVDRTFTKDNNAQERHLKRDLNHLLSLCMGDEVLIWMIKHSTYMMLFGKEEQFLSEIKNQNRKPGKLLPGIRKHLVKSWNLFTGKIIESSRVYIFLVKEITNFAKKERESFNIALLARSIRLVADRKMERGSDKFVIVNEEEQEFNKNKLRIYKPRDFNFSVDIDSDDSNPDEMSDWSRDYSKKEEIKRQAEDENFKREKAMRQLIDSVSQNQGREKRHESYDQMYDGIMNKLGKSLGLIKGSSKVKWNYKKGEAKQNHVSFLMKIKRKKRKAKQDHIKRRKREKLRLEKLEKEDTSRDRKKISNLLGSTMPTIKLDYKDYKNISKDNSQTIFNNYNKRTFSGSRNRTGKNFFSRGSRGRKRVSASPNYARGGMMRSRYKLGNQRKSSSNVRNRRKSGSNNRLNKTLYNIKQPRNVPSNLMAEGYFF